MSVAESVILFVFILFGSSATSLLYSKSKNANAALIFLILSFLIMFIPAAIRDISVGSDTVTYVSMFYGINDRPFLYENYEPLYVALNRFVGFVGLGYRGMLIIFSFLTYLFVFLSVPRKYLYIVVPMYILIAYPYSMSMLRQALAITIAMYALRLFLNKMYIKTIIWLFISAGFHKSGIVYLPLFLFFFLFKVKTKYIIPIAIIGYILASRIFTSQFVIENIAVILGYTSRNITQVFNVVSQTSGIGSLLKKTLIAMPAIYLVLSNKKNDNMLKNIVLLTFPLLIIANVYHSQSQIFNRLTMFFWVVYGVVFVCVCQTKSRYRKIVVYLILCGWFFLFVFDLQKDPKIEGFMSVIPYKTMFQY